MLSIHDIVQKTAKQRELIERTMDSWGMYHPNIRTPEHTLCNLTEGLKEADAIAVKEAMHHIPLSEFLAKSGTTGIAGAVYLVPDKVHDDLIFYSKQTDFCNQIGQVVTGWPGGDLKVDVVNDATYIAKEFVSGGQFATETIETEQLTITPKSFGVSARITNDLIDDANFGMIDFHLRNAALAIGDYATTLALTVLITATDGWGTRNASLTGDADETKLVGGATADIGDTIRALGEDRWLANTLVTTPESWAHSISTQACEVGWSLQPTAVDYHAKLGILDVLLLHNTNLHDSTDVVDAAFTACINLVFDRNNAILTGRKRWMQINNYADPVRDLAGATLTSRQDTVSLYNDAVYILTET